MSSYDRLFEAGWADAKRLLEKGYSADALRFKAARLKNTTARERGYRNGFFAALDLTEGIEHFRCGCSTEK